MILENVDKITWVLLLIELMSILNKIIGIYWK